MTALDRGREPTPEAATDPATEPALATRAHLPCWSSRELLCGARMAVIVHEGVRYRLQLTRQNKLLLTK